MNMDGPAFSTRAESEANRQLGFDVVGMTNLPEAKLAREAEIALATLCMVTDYDCWHEDEENVSVETVIGNLVANAANAQKIVASAVAMIPDQPHWPEIWPFCCLAVHLMMRHTSQLDRYPLAA